MKNGRVVLTVNHAPILDVDLYTLITVMQAAGNRIHGSGAVDMSHPDVRLEVDGDEIGKPDWMHDDDDAPYAADDLPMMLKKQAD